MPLIVLVVVVVAVLFKLKAMRNEMRRRQWLMDSVSFYSQYQNPRTEAAATAITI